MKTKIWMMVCLASCRNPFKTLSSRVYITVYRSWGNVLYYWSTAQHILTPCLHTVVSAMLILFLNTTMLNPVVLSFLPWQKYSLDLQLSTFTPTILINVIQLFVLSDACYAVFFLRRRSVLLTPPEFIQTPSRWNPNALKSLEQTIMLFALCWASLLNLF